VIQHPSDPLFGGDSETDPFSLAVGAIGSIVVIALVIAVLLILR
jgi:hypothetical protein